MVSHRCMTSLVEEKVPVLLLFKTTCLMYITTTSKNTYTFLSNEKYH